MFGHRYFSSHYFGPRYFWPSVGPTADVTASFHATEAADSAMFRTIGSFDSRLDIDPVLLPTTVQIESVGGPEVESDIIPSTGGIESRRTTSGPRDRFQLKFGPESAEQVMLVFRCSEGPTRGFMIQDPRPGENTATDEVLEQTIEDYVTVCQLTKTQSVLNYFTNTVFREYIREVLLPDPATLVVNVNAVVQSSPGDYALAADGVIVFTSALDPDTQEVTASFKFFKAVRPDAKWLAVTAKEYNIDEIQTLELLEVLPRPVA